VKHGGTHAEANDGYAYCGGHDGMLCYKDGEPTTCQIKNKGCMIPIALFHGVNLSSSLK
jgi:hypothetical protein